MGEDEPEQHRRTTRTILKTSFSLMSSLQKHAAQRVQTMHLDPGAKSFHLLPLQSPSLYFCKSTHPPIRLDRVSVHMQYAETNFLCVS